MNTKQRAKKIALRKKQVKRKSTHIIKRKTLPDGWKVIPALTPEEALRIRIDTWAKEKLAELDKWEKDYDKAIDEIIKEQNENPVSPEDEERLRIQMLKDEGLL